MSRLPGLRNYLKVFTLFLTSYILLLSSLYILPVHKTYAQEIGLDKTSPQLQAVLSSGFNIDSLTLAQCKAIETELSKRGGQVPPEAEKILKKCDSLKELKKENGEAIAPEEEGKEEIKAEKDKAPIDKKEEKPEIKIKDEKKEEKIIQPLERFGLAFFKPAKTRILSIEEMIGKGQKPQVLQKDAVSGFVGPLDMVSSYVNATIPPQYMLSPGDKVTLYYWGDMIELTEAKLLLDEKGEVSLPKAGRIVARGMTLSQFQTAVKEQLQRVMGKNISLIASLDSLKSIQIFITGEAFRPGSYAVSAVTTLFNALYASGGPSDSGSLRDIKLIRNNKTINVDFYNYLLKGESKDDYPLEAGDTVFISKAGKLVSIEGEVNRPAIYELKREERLKDLIALGNGIKPTGMLNNIQIKSVIPNKERVVVDLDITKNSASSNYELFDGDSVVVASVLPEVENIVTIEGKVERPGVYELKKDMKVSDLFSDINKPLGEAYMERADILRLNEDKKTTSLIPVNLGKVLSKEPDHDIKLAPMDKLIVYSKWDISFFPPRKVTISGSVQKPGDYERSDDMTLKDLLIKAGGVLPNTYMDRADLLRYDFEKESYTNLPVNIKKVIDGDETENLILKDKDSLRIYTLKDVQFFPPRVITVVGSVQRPGNFERSEGMTLKDLLIKAGGVLPNTYMDRADLLRYDFEKESYTNLPVNIKKVIDGDEAEHIVLKDKDLLRIYLLKDIEFTPPHEVSILGTVQRPGVYTRFEGMKLSDLLRLSGGILPGGLEEIEIARARSEGEIKIIKSNLESLNNGDQSQDILLNDEDMVMVRKRSEFYDKPIWVTIGGEVKYPGVYSLKGKEDKISNLIERAGGLTKYAYPKGTVFTRKRENFPSDEQRRDVTLANKIADALNNFEYFRQSARNQWLLQKESGQKEVSPLSGAGVPMIATSGTPSQAAAIGLAPGVSQAAGQVAGGVIETFESAPKVVSKSRRLGEGELVQSERVILNLEEALTGGEDNIILMDGDVIDIPQRVETVSVVGAVTRPTTIHIKSKTQLQYYIDKSGGFTTDADPKRVTVMRVDGSITPAHKVKYLEEGDIVYVPPRVMSLDIVERIDKIINVVKYALVTTASVVVFVTLIGLF